MVFQFLKICDTSYAEQSIFRMLSLSDIEQFQIDSIIQYIDIFRM